MPDTLHILNGDSTLWQLNATDIKGDRLVWRDVLSDGPVLADFGSDQFWKIRTEFMCQAFGTTPEGFKAKVIDEFNKIESLNQYNEVILWFEYDLFCQINMVGIMHYLSEHIEASTQLSLICVGHVPGHPHLVGLGELEPAQLPKLLEQRSQLDFSDLKYASEVYLAYCASDPIGLVNLDQHAIFHYLKGALQAHFQRFPDATTGLTKIERTMLQFINEGANSPKEIVGRILRWQKGTYYGFGDSQYFNYLKRLKPLLGEDFSLNEQGQWVLNGSQSAQGLINRDYMLGGVKVSDYVWDEALQQLQKV